jgi:intracellular sulfur oxidation DsrE/DsrF family protein
MQLKSIVMTTLLFLLASQASLAAEPVKYRMLLQVSENSVDKLNLALNTAMNAQETFGPENIEVELVVFGDGVNTLKYYAPIPIADKVEEATTEGLRIVVCEIAMRSHKLRPSDMLEEVRYVPSGVAELVEKQTLGWSYIRP